MKQQEDQVRSEHQFAEGHRVFLRLQTYKKTSLKDEQLSEATDQILWSLYSSQAWGTSRISVSSAQSVEATSCFSCFMLKEGDWNQVPSSNQPSRFS
jgi:hypothetical protein